MSDVLFDKLLCEEVNVHSLINWLLNNPEDCANDNFQEIAKCNCTQNNFVAYFINFVHDKINCSFDDQFKSKQNTTKNLLESHQAGTTKSSNPINLSTLIESDVTNSPVSPLYRPQNDFSTPNNNKHQNLCLGDFIIAANKSSSTKKKIGKIRDASANKRKTRRINPTNLNCLSNDFNLYKTDNSYNFNGGSCEIDAETANEQRFHLAEERMKILARNDLNVNQKIKRSFSNNIEPKISWVTCKHQIDIIIEIYATLIDFNLILNVSSEIYFLVSLLTSRQVSNQDDMGVNFLNDEPFPLFQTKNLFGSIHNVIYFACKSLEKLNKLLLNYDKSTIKLLIDNERLVLFSPGLIENLRKVWTEKEDRWSESSGEIIQDNVCFNLDTDNRENFPTSLSFQVFRKQRDLFYEILTIWETHHSTPSWSFNIALGGKIRTLTTLNDEPTNFLHLAKLFVAQLMKNCWKITRDKEKDVFFSLYPNVNAEKLSLLENRLITKQDCDAYNSSPSFAGRQEFYKDFIIVAGSYNFNQHLSDVIITEIIQLSQTRFIDSQLNDKDESIEPSIRKSFIAKIKDLRILAKFIGLIHSLPYKSQYNYPESLLQTHLNVRKQINPNFDVKRILEESTSFGALILCIPWLTKYLAMLDRVTLEIPYYKSISKLLLTIYKKSNAISKKSNDFLIKCCLGWLFALPHFPSEHIADDIQPKLISQSNSNCLDNRNIVDQNVLYVCCPYLDEIKKLLLANNSGAQKSVTLKHITPITALQSPERVAKKRLEQQLEETFFNGQPIGIKKVVEFVSEQIASTCVKFICGTVVPNFKNSNVAEMICQSKNDGENFKIDHIVVDLTIKLIDLCLNESETLCKEKVSKSMDSLLALDVLDKTKQVCVTITTKMCIERVKQWINSHINSVILIKAYEKESNKCTNGKLDRPIFALPPVGSKKKHNPETLGPFHLFEKIRDFSVDIFTSTFLIDVNSITNLLNDAILTLSERNDVNQCVCAGICNATLDLSILLVSFHYDVITIDILSKFTAIWRLYYGNTNELFKNLICPRNVMILAQSGDVTKAWTTFAMFCAYLVDDNLLNCDDFESQCVAIYKNEWDEITLKHLTSFFDEFIKLYRRKHERCDKFTILVEFLSDYCCDL